MMTAPATTLLRRHNARVATRAQAACAQARAPAFLDAICAASTPRGGGA